MKRVNQANEFDEWYRRNPTGNIQTFATNEFIAKHIKPSENRILEIGFGNGELAKQLIAQGKYVRGIEKSRVAHQVTGIKRPRKGEKFDLAIMIQVLDHIPNQRCYLKRLKQKCDGALILLLKDSPKNCPWHYHEGIQKDLHGSEIGGCSSQLLLNFYNWFYERKPYRALGLNGGLKQKKSTSPYQENIGKFFYYLDRLLPHKREVLYRLNFTKTYDRDTMKYWGLEMEEEFRGWPLPSEL